VVGDNFGATRESADPWCDSNPGRCVGCEPQFVGSCEPADNAGGFTVWYTLHSWSSVAYTVTVTDGTATGTLVTLYRNHDGSLFSLAAVRSCVRCVQAAYPAFLLHLAAAQAACWCAVWG
jgi:hypothetical protein